MNCKGLLEKRGVLNRVTRYPVVGSSVSVRIESPRDIRLFRGLLVSYDLSGLEVPEERYKIIELELAYCLKTDEIPLVSFGNGGNFELIAASEEEAIEWRTAIAHNIAFLTNTSIPRDLRARFDYFGNPLDLCPLKKELVVHVNGIDDPNVVGDELDDAPVVQKAHHAKGLFGLFFPCLGRTGLKSDRSNSSSGLLLPDSRTSDSVNTVDCPSNLLEESLTCSTDCDVERESCASETEECHGSLELSDDTENGSHATLSHEIIVTRTFAGETQTCNHWPSGGIQGGSIYSHDFGVKSHAQSEVVQSGVMPINEGNSDNQKNILKREENVSSLLPLETDSQSQAETSVSSPSEDSCIQTTAVAVIEEPIVPVAVPMKIMSVVSAHALDEIALSEITVSSEAPRVSEGDSQPVTSRLLVLERIKARHANIRQQRIRNTIEITSVVSDHSLEEIARSETAVSSEAPRVSEGDSQPVTSRSPALERLRARHGVIRQRNISQANGLVAAVAST